MVVPLSYFIEKPFQNWTSETSALIGSIFLYVDYTVPVEKLREKLLEIVRAVRVGLALRRAREAHCVFAGRIP